MLSQEISDAFGVSHTTGKQNCIDVSSHCNRHSAYFLGYGIDHGAKYEHGVKISMVNHIKDLRNRGCA